MPLYPYGRRRTLVRELVPDRIWSFEQLHGVWYVAVPIRMTVVRVEDGLLLYAPVPPTQEVLAALCELERRIGPVRAIVLPTASGLEHKLPVPAMARAFPGATVWLSPHQWSFPLTLPSRWLGFPAGRTKYLLEDGIPYGNQLEWRPLGPIDLGLGTFMEMACFDRATSSLLVTDALVVISADPPPVFTLDPTPLLFHARERGSELLDDRPELRLRGWLRLVAFANYLRPDQLHIPPIGKILADAFAPGCRNARSHFGIYPFQWLEGWQQQVEILLSHPGEEPHLLVAPVLERLVFPRSRSFLITWLDSLPGRDSSLRLISAHYDAPVMLPPGCLDAFRQALSARAWAPDDGPWQFLSRIDSTLRHWHLVP
ncbi:MAG: DUF4336 domain-containing protein [Cyanobium sp.]